MGRWDWRRAPAATFAVAGILMLALASLQSDGRDARAAVNCDVADYSNDGQESTFVSLVNAYRGDNGLGSLSVDSALNRAATWLVEDMGANAYFSHTDSLGRSPYQRAIDCGYPGGAGENIAAGSSWDTAQEVFDAWKASPGHNANLLGQYYNEIGIARVYVSGSPYGWYWAADFGAGGGGDPTAVPPTNTPTKTPTPAAATATPTKTPTPAAATATPTTTPTSPAATATPTTTPTSAAATATPTKTPTSAAATATPTKTPTSAAATATPTKTPTSAAATATLTKTPTSAAATATPTRTPTSGAPTATPTRTPTAGAPASLALRPGANLIAWPGNDTTPAQALSQAGGSVSMVYRWDAAARRWQRYSPSLPAFANTIATLRKGEAYWVIASGQAQVAVP